MKKAVIIIVLLAVAVWGSFYTENLAEKYQRELLNNANPDKIVAVTMRDSLQSLSRRAISVGQLKASLLSGDTAFANAHARYLGIGSAAFYVVGGKVENAITKADELQGDVDGVAVKIPLKYIFGNNARDASGWFLIDDFKNTMDFNAVSAVLNKFIASSLKGRSFQGEVSFTGAVAIKDGAMPDTLEITPYQLQ